MIACWDEKADDDDLGVEGADFFCRNLWSSERVCAFTGWTLSKSSILALQSPFVFCVSILWRKMGIFISCIDTDTTPLCYVLKTVSFSAKEAASVSLRYAALLGTNDINCRGLSVSRPLCPSILLALIWTEFMDLWSCPVHYASFLFMGTVETIVFQKCSRAFVGPFFLFVDGDAFWSIMLALDFLGTRIFFTWLASWVNLSKNGDKPELLKMNDNRAEKELGDQWNNVCLWINMGLITILLWQLKAIYI